MENREYIIFTNETNRHFVDSISELQSNINLASYDKEYKVIAISSASAGEGKSTLAANLAYLYSLKGKKTLLINLDLRKPTSHYFFNVIRDEGIVEYCAGECSKEDIIKHTDYKGLDIITSGKKTMFASELISSLKVKNLVDELKSQYDYIIVDTSPINDVTDALLTKNFIDGVVLVVRHNKSKINSVKEAVNKLNENGIDIIGSVLVGVKHKTGYYYYYSDK